MTDRLDGGHAIAGAMTLGMTSGPSRDYTPAVYGALLVTTLIAGQWSGGQSATFVVASLLVSVGVFWLTHVWSAIVNRRLHGRLTWAGVGPLARHDAPMLAALVVPSVVLLAGGWLGATVDQTMEAALIASVAQLFVWGLAVGRSVHFAWWPAVRVAAVDCALGLVIVALKVFVLH